MLRLYYKLALVKQLPTLLRTLPTPLPLSPCTVWAQIFAYVSITRPVIYFIFGLPYEFAQRVDGGRGWQDRRERERDSQHKTGNSFTWTLPGAAVAVIDI